MSCEGLRFYEEEMRDVSWAYGSSQKAGKEGRMTYKAKIATKGSIEVPKDAEVLFPVGRVGDILHETGHCGLHNLLF